MILENVISVTNVTSYVPQYAVLGTIVYLICINNLPVILNTLISDYTQTISSFTKNYNLKTTA